MKRISNNSRLFASAFCLFAFATTAANGQVMEAASLLANIGILQVNHKCTTSWDWLVPLFRGSEACGCRQSYVIVQSHNKEEDRTGPKMVFDHSEFNPDVTKEFKNKPPPEFSYGTICQSSKSAVIPPMGTGGAEVGNSDSSPNGLKDGKLYWNIYDQDGVKLDGCQLVVSVDNYAALGFGKNQISGTLSGCGSYTDKVPGLTLEFSEFLEKPEGASRIIYVYMKDAKPKAQASSIGEDIPWPVEDFNGNQTAMAPGMAPGAAPTIPSPSSKPQPSPSPSPVPPSSSASTAGTLFAMVCIAAATAAVAAGAF